MLSHLASIWRRYETILGPLCGLVFVWSLFALLTTLKQHHDYADNDISWMESFKSAWFNANNLTDIVSQSTIVGVAALGATIILISGGLDLSVGSTIALSTIVTALLLRMGMHPAVAMAGGVGAGALAGLAIGHMVIGNIGWIAPMFLAFLIVIRVVPSFGLGTGMSFLVGAACIAAAGAAGWAVTRVTIRRIELTPFIVTLGMMAILRGTTLSLVPSGQTEIKPSQDLGFLADFMRSGPLGLPSATWVFLGLAAGMALLLRYTAFGRHLFAIGSNEETARLCGIPVPRTKALIYMLAVGLAGMAGVMQFCHINCTGSATVAEGIELTVIAACVIGGTSLSGGEGSIIGTLIGVLILKVVSLGCSKMGWDSWVQLVVTGSIILAAVVLDRLRHRKPS
jgi:ribose/xylose/arabinose/galactoside ABC-type transport system permease subunit